MRPSDLVIAHQHIHVNGIGVHYVEKGAGPLVVLLHGFPETWWTWRRQIDALVGEGFRVVAPDLRGFGESDKQGPFDVDTLSNDVAVLMSALGEERGHVVGHDWGGAIAWHFAMRHAGRLGRLAIVNCPPVDVLRRALLSSPSQRAASRYIFQFQIPGAAERKFARDGRAIMERIYRESVTDASNFGEDDIAPFIDAIAQRGAIRAAMGYYRTSFRDAILGRTRARRRDRVTAPTLVVWGMRDHALQADVLLEPTAAAAENVRVLRVENAGHFVHAERPEIVNEALITHLRG